MIELSRHLRGALACAVVSACALISAPSHAQPADAWQSVRQAGVLRCGAAVAPPYVARDPKTGAYSGFFVALCQQFGDALNVKVEFIDTTWDNIVAGLQANKWDLSLALNDTPERRKAIAFSQGVTGYNVSLVYNTHNPKIATTPQAITDIDKPDITIAVMSGTSQDKAISAEVKHANIMRLPGNDETRLALMSKRADLLADANITNMLLTEAHPDWAASLNPNPPLAQQWVSFGIRKETPEADVQALDSFVAQRIQSGEVDQLIKKSVQEMLATGAK